jgi:predicted dehydrogenase
VDRDLKLAECVASKWRVPRFGTTFREVAPDGADVAILAIPPGERFSVLKDLVGVRALLVEKPLGRTESEGRDFLNACAARNILVQVNLWRRADERMRELASKREELVGRVQAAFAVYGNGLHNNGTHIVDAIRMVLGEVRSVWSAPSTLTLANGPIDGDVHVSSVLMLETGVAVHLAPLDFKS